MQIFKTVFGSHLYGLATDKSDKDFKAIHIPSLDDLFLSRASKTIQQKTKEGYDSKNTSDDVDFESYSLKYYIDLLLEQQTVALDMLYSTPSVS